MKNLFSNFNRLLILTCTLMVSRFVWGDTATTSSLSSKSTSAVTVESGKPITYKCSSSNTYENPARIYKDATFTVGCTDDTKPITKIEITSPSGNPATGFSTTVGKYEATSTVGTWTGNAQSVVFTASAQVRVSALTVTYGAAFTLTAVSNNNSWGTVSLTDKTITCTPAAGYYVASASSSSVAITPTVNGNIVTCTGTLTENTIVTVNFAAKEAATVILSEAGTPTTVSGTRYVGDNYTLPSSTEATCGVNKVLVGWSTVEVSETDTKPTSNYYEKGQTITLTNASTTFYAVFATSSGGGEASWTETEITDLSGSDIFVISDGSYAMTNSNGTSSAPSATSITVASSKITSTVNDNMKWNIGGNGTDGYVFYPNGSSKTWLYCNTTASSSSNNNIRVGTGDRKLWVISNSKLKTNDSYTARYLSNYTNSDFRGYTSSSSAITPKFYKYSDGTTYSGYTTSCASAAVFSAGETLFLKSQGEGAWGSSACVKVWFHGGSGDKAVTPTWMYNEGSTTYKMFYVIVPAEADGATQAQLQRFASNCSDWWNSNGDANAADRGDKNTIKTTGTGTNDVSWHSDVYSTYIKGSVDNWVSNLATFTDDGNGNFVATISNAAPSGTIGEAASFDFKTVDSNGRWYPNDDVTLSGLKAGSTYNIDASFNIGSRGTLNLSKTLVKASVRFDANGHGEAPSSVTNITPNTTISAPTSPTATGWDFGGWYKESACTNAWDFTNDKVTESMTLYAKWTEATKYTVTYYGNGNTDGSVPTDATQYLYGATVTVKTNTGSLTKTGYDFGGWNTKEDGSGTNYTAGTGTFTITANTPLYAKWNLKSYTVTKGTVMGGTATIPSSVNHGGDVTVTDLTPDATHKLPYEITVSGTYGSIDGATIKNVTSNITVNVTFTAKTQYTVTLLNNNNPVNKEGFDAQGQKTYYEGQTLGTLPTLTSADACDNTSKTFMGWAAEKISTKRENAPSYVDSSTEVTQTITYYAVWAKEQ